MLVLSRKPGERIFIGDDIVVTVVRIGPNNARLGIDSPKDVKIYREELLQDEPDKQRLYKLPTNAQEAIPHRYKISP